MRSRKFQERIGENGIANGIEQFLLRSVNCWRQTCFTSTSTYWAALTYCSLIIRWLNSCNMVFLEELKWNEMYFGLFWCRVTVSQHVTACHSVLHSFEASRVQQPVKVITGAPVVQQTAAAGTPFTANLASAQQFPSLGTRTLYGSLRYLTVN
jgi:hypothetical protein